MARFNPDPVSTMRQRNINRLKSNTELNDITEGSELYTLSDTIAKEDYKQMVEIGDILSLDDLDNIRGTELDLEGQKYELPREEAIKAYTSDLIIKDSSITKISSVIKSTGADAGDYFLPVNDTSDFPSNGTLLIGERTESEFEEKVYTSKTVDGFNLSIPLVNDHGASEPVVLKTVGDRLFTSGQQVKVPSSANQDEIIFDVTTDWTIYDGEEDSTAMRIVCTQEGVVGNVIAESITEFNGTKPFVNAVPYNPTSLLTGKETESDDAYRERIRNQPARLKRGTREAIEAEVKTAKYNEQSVVFVQSFESVNNCDPSITYIDDGTGFTPEYETISEEIIIEEAVGGEKYFQLLNFPLKTDVQDLRLYKNVSSLDPSGTLLVENTDYIINKYTGEGKLLSPLAANDNLRAGNSNLSDDGYQHYTGLLAVAQWKINGLSETLYQKYPNALPFSLGYSYTDFPGATYGNALEVTVPTIYSVSIEAEVTMKAGTNKDQAIQTIKQNLISYVNNLGIGKTVVKDQLRLAGLRTANVSEFSLSIPASNIETPDGMLPRLVASNINIV